MNHEEFKQNLINANDIEKNDLMNHLNIASTGRSLNNITLDFRKIANMEYLELVDNNPKVYITFEKGSEFNYRELIDLINEKRKKIGYFINTNIEIDENDTGFFALGH